MSLDTNSTTQSYPISQGWTCYRCGTWVPNGTTHSCFTTSTYPTTIVQRGTLTDDEIERIARRVVELLGTRLAHRGDE